MGDFSISSLAASFIYGIIGLWMFREGRRLLKHKVMVIGIFLMVYPYFTHGPLLDWGVGAALCGLAYAIWDKDV